MRRLSVLLILLAVLLTGCTAGRTSESDVKLDPKNPITVTVWHYFNGPILNAFQASINLFNETVGMQTGIIVEHRGLGSVFELEKAVLASANGEVGSMAMPNIFASYADTAYEAERMGLLADLEDHFPAHMQAEYLDSYIEEGRIGRNGELRIFPITKATEVLILNETDWLPFARDTGCTYADLATMEGIARVAQAYYAWSGGKSLFGRDAMANLFVVASKAFGTEIFEVSGGVGRVNINRNAMRAIWDTYYIPYVSGYFSAYGRFRSDDAKVGELLMYVGSTSSATFFPVEVTVDRTVYPITAKVLPSPVFSKGRHVLVQQGAGMVVTKDTPEKEYASVEFLKWFTDTEQNIKFAALTGYMPVKKDANDYAVMTGLIKEQGIEIAPIVYDALRVALEQINSCELYTSKAFESGAVARALLETNLQAKAAADREAVQALIASGLPNDQAVLDFITEEAFEAWLASLTAQLEEAIA